MSMSPYLHWVYCLRGEVDLDPGANRWGMPPVTLPPSGLPARQPRWTWTWNVCAVLDQHPYDKVQGHGGPQEHWHVASEPFPYGKAVHFWMTTAWFNYTISGTVAALEREVKLRGYGL